MKQSFIVVVAALIVVPAFAADMAVKAPPPPAAPVYSWTGFYAGLNAGGGWGGKIDNSVTPSTCTFSALACSAFFAGLNAIVPGQFSTHPSGFIGGGQIGYNLLPTGWRRSRPISRVRI